MTVYETAFYWIGVLSALFFVMLGMAFFSAWVMNMVWQKFKDGKDLYDIIDAWKTQRRNTND